jgi:pyruvate formate lyase activating enzyme
MQAPFKQQIFEQEIFDYLDQRRAMLDGVVITGGEPTLQPDLRAFIEKIKNRGLKVKLDTCGYRPEVLEPLLNAKVLDYVAMDIKAPLIRYHELVNIPVDPSKITTSIALLQKNTVPYEFRSTLIEGFHTPDDVRQMVQLISGAPKYYLQRFQPLDSVYNQEFRGKHPLAESIMRDIAQEAREFVKECEIRG